MQPEAAHGEDEAAAEFGRVGDESHGSVGRRSMVTVSPASKRRGANGLVNHAGASSTPPSNTVMFAARMAAGQLLRPVVEPVAEPDQFRQADTALAGPGVEADALVEQGHLDVLDHGVLREQVVRLEDEPEISAADLRKLVVRHLRHVLL